MHPARTTEPLTTIASQASDSLDLATVMKASQVISGEIILRELLSKLMELLIENAGAQKGYLILPREADPGSTVHWVIEAEGRVDPDQTTVLHSMPIDFVDPSSQTPILPATIFNYVVRTQETVVLDNAAKTGSFMNDPYIIAVRGKSILCMPLVYRGTLNGVVYLENDLTTGAFTQDRVELLRILAGQAAISIENSRLYEQLGEYNRTLEQRVAERTRELSEALDQLKKTQEILIEAEKMATLGQLAASIAHEVNTPLGAIRAAVTNITRDLEESLETLPELFQQLTPDQAIQFFELLDVCKQGEQVLSTREERQLRRKVRDQLEAGEVSNADTIATFMAQMGVDQSLDLFFPLLRLDVGVLVVQSAYQLVNQMRSSSNILLAVDRAAKITFALQTYQRQDQPHQQATAFVQEGINDVLSIYEHWLKKGIEVTKAYDDVPAILCYPDELNQVWTNLIHNAIQAMGDRGHLRIRVKQDHDSICVQVTDSGSGIPVEIQDKIFNPFFTTKSAGEGSGLGLDICRRIVAKHQGRIEFESQPGQTTFRVFLPITIRDTNHLDMIDD